MSSYFGRVSVAVIDVLDGKQGAKLFSLGGTVFEKVDWLKRRHCGAHQVANVAMHGFQRFAGQKLVVDHPK